MRHIIIGLGSIGRRHYRNLVGLLPAGNEHEVITVDPDKKCNADYTKVEGDIFQDAVVYICAPTKEHAGIIHYSYWMGAKSIAVEKPLHDTWGEIELFPGALPIATLYCYRYHPVFRALKRNSPVDILVMTAQDDLVSRYGATALETMASHSIDAALWVNGPAKSWDTIDNGESCSVQIYHLNGCLSQIRCNISKSPRISGISYRRAGYRHQAPVPANDQMYIDEMKAWLNFLNTGDRGDLCFYEDAMQVQKIMQGSSQ